MHFDLQSLAKLLVYSKTYFTDIHMIYRKRQGRILKKIRFLQLDLDLVV